MKEKIYLFDGSAYIFRAFYATPRLTNSEGFPTNALYGFARMCLKFLRESAPQYAIMVFDAGQKTFRNDLYPDYKANRAECPEDLSVQMPHFRTLSRALGFQVIETPGYEADDIIGTLCHELREHDHEVVIVSADKDLMQLVTDQVVMWDTMRDKWYDPSAVQEKLGVLPDQVIEYLAIAGDSSDNIPGLKGAGPKTAVQLIERFGTVEKILAATEEIREEKGIRGRKKIAEQLESDPELLKVSKALVTIKTDLSLEFGEMEDRELLESLRYRGPVEDALAEIAEQFSFQSLIEEYDLSAPSASSTEFSQEYELILRKDFSAWAEKFQQQERFCFDLETTSLDVHEAKIVGFACCWDDEKAYYIPCGHEERADEQASFPELCEVIAPRLSDASTEKRGQNLKYDIGVLLTAGIEVSGVLFDTMIAAYLLHPDLSGYGLSQLAKSYLGYEMTEYESVVADGADFAAVPLEAALHYAAEDAHITWLLSEKLLPLIEEAGLTRVSFEVENPLVRVLAEIEHRGIVLESSVLKEMSVELDGKLQRLEREVYRAAGEEFNMNSPKQIGEILFEKLGLPTAGVKKTKTGFSTNQAVLEKLKGVHEVPALLVEYRILHKLKSTYLDSLPKEVSPHTGRLHTRLNQTVAATGRLSSSEPNLQNIPIQTALGRKVRKAFVPPEGSLFIAADYSQVELRFLAHLSGDESLIESFQQEIDIHERTAREVLDLAPDAPVSGEERRLGKTMNFGIVYGMSGFRLARELGIPVSAGTDYIERYFARYPRVREYFDSLERQMEERGEVRTILGRRRLLGEIQQGARDRNFVKRAALNAPLQGSAADLIKLAMLRMERVIREESLPLRPVLQVHDELLFEADVTEEESERLRSLTGKIAHEMESAMALDVPLRVDVSVGKNWEEAHS
ncbi:DNA polymerase I [bacterium]|nr:DNA polymerase I [bacterium]